MAEVRLSQQSKTKNCSICLERPCSASPEPLAPPGGRRPWHREYEVKR